MAWIGKNRKLALIAGVLIVAVLILAAVSRRGREQVVHESAVAETVNVAAVSVLNMEVPSYHESPGTVRPRTESDVAAKIMSTVSSVHVREGDHVSAGQVLVRLEGSDLAAQEAQAAAALAASRTRVSTARTAAELQKAQSSAGVENARAALSAAREQLALAQSGPRPQERTQAHLAVAQAEAQARNAEADLVRMKRLYDQDVIPRQRLDAAQTARDVAQAQLEAARQQASMVEEGSRQEDIRAAQAHVRQAEEALKLARASIAQNSIRAGEARTASADADRAAASLRYARVAKGYTVLRAPISGLVTRRMTDPGDMVQPGVPLITIEESAEYRLEASVPEDYTRSLYTGKQVGVQVEGSGDRWLPARVVQIIPAADRNSRTFVAKVSIPGGVRVRSGEFGRMRFEVGRERGLFVPASALVTGSGLTGVYVIDSDRVARYRLVKPGKESGGMVRILAGLSEGDRVASSDISRLEDGTPVRLRNGVGQPSTAAAPSVEEDLHDGGGESR